MNQPLVTIGFIIYSEKGGYSSKKYLAQFLESLTKQSYHNVEILCLDNGSTDEGEALQEVLRYPQVRVMRLEKNIGYAGHNRMIAEAQGKYYLCTNFDIQLDPDMLTHLVAALEEDVLAASSAGASYRWDFQKQILTDIVDTTGLEIFRSHHVRDREMGEMVAVSDMQQRSKEEIFGSSGVNILFRMDALRSVCLAPQEYFDEHFLMYKEDVDLAYRLQWAGWKALFVPQALLWHDRSVGEEAQSRSRIVRILKNRTHKSKQNRIFSVRNHLFMLYKNFSLTYSWKVKVATLWDEVRKFFWVLLFESFALNAYMDFWRMRKSLIPSKKVVKETDIERWMK